MTKWSRGRLALALGLVSVVAGTATAVATGAVRVEASGGPAKAASIYTAAQKAAGKYQAVTFSAQGTSYKIVKQAGGTKSFTYTFGKRPRGNHAAADTTVVVMRDGAVKQEVDTMSAKGLPTVRVWADSSDGTVFGKILPKGCAIIFSNDSNSFVTIGQPFGFADHPSFTGATRSGADWLVDSTYSLAGGTAHEQDTITASDSRWAASTLDLKGGPYSGTKLSLSKFGYHRRQAIETPPQLGEC